ncbi:MAG: OmpA family protein [Prolixibacteraceae bacterium]
MKNKFLLMCVTVLFAVGAFAQESTKTKPDYNRWSIEGGFGLTKPYGHWSSSMAETADWFASELGVRYMLNQYFGLKMNLTYNQFTEADGLNPFTTDLYNLSLQGVINMGRIMKFESWTRTFNLLGHGGMGVGSMEFDNPLAGIDGEDVDHIGNFLAGFTLQAKLSPRVSLYGDATWMANYNHDVSIDGLHINDKDSRSGVINGTIGLSIALGRKATHADWYVSDDAIAAAFDSRLTAVENGLSQNKNGDQQLSGRVDELGRKVDDLDRKVASLPTDTGTDPNELIAKLINDGYVNIYFDFNSTKIKGATNTINVLRTYLVNNPNVNVDLLGYADERGTEEYNIKLSQKRADAVAKMLSDAGVDPSRLNAQGKGEDISIDKTTPEAYQLARRVSFVVK